LTKAIEDFDRLLRHLKLKRFGGATSVCLKKIQKPAIRHDSVVEFRNPPNGLKRRTP
jgi:hypothetical protein